MSPYSTEHFQKTTDACRSVYLNALFLLTALAASSAFATDPAIYVCTNAEGRKELTETNKGSGCKILELPKPDRKPARKGKGGVRLGMTMDEVVKSSRGRPNRVNRTINASGTTEQWVYDGGYLYFTDGVLTTIQN